MMKKRFPLNIHPSRLSWLQGASREEILSDPGQGRYALLLDPENPDHRQAFRKYFNAGAISFNGHVPDVLARFEPGFNSPDSRNLIEEIETARREMSDVRDLEQIAKIEEQDAIKARDENSDPSHVPELQRMVRQTAEAREDQAQMVAAYHRKISSLNDELRQALIEERRRQADELRRQIDPLIEEFNVGIRRAYSPIPQIEELIRELSGVHPDPIPPHVDYSTVVVTNSEGGRLKRFKILPQIRKDHRGHYRFELAKRKDS